MAIPYVWGLTVAMPGMKGCIRVVKYFLVLPATVGILEKRGMDPFQFVS